MNLAFHKIGVPKKKVPKFFWILKRFASPKKFESQTNFGPEKISGPKKFGSQKTLGPKKNRVPKKIGSQKLGSNKNLGPDGRPFKFELKKNGTAVHPRKQIVHPRNQVLRKYDFKIWVPKKNWVPKKIWILKKFASRKNLSPKKNWVPKKIGSQKNMLVLIFAGRPFKFELKNGTVVHPRKQIVHPRNQVQIAARSIYP